MRNWIAGLLACCVLVGSGCGPTAIGVGASELLDDENSNPPTVDLAATATGEALSPFAPGRFETVVLVQGEGTAVQASVVPAPGCDPTDPEDPNCPTDRSARFQGVATVRNGIARFVVGPELLPGGNPNAQEPALDPIEGDQLPEGVYVLFVRVGGTTQRHLFAVDGRPPDQPIVLELTAAEPRAVEVRWTPVDDPAGEGSEASGVVGYRVYFDVGSASLPDDGLRVFERQEDGRTVREIRRRIRNQDYPGRGLQTSAEGTVLRSPVFVEGADTSTFTLTGLFAGRVHAIQVTAVDRAGNESAFREERVVRTRMGGDGAFRMLDPVAAGTEPRGLAVGDVNNDGIQDVVVATTSPPGNDAGQVLLLLGQGAGRVGTGVLVPAATQPPPHPPDGFVAVAVADLDRDTDLDLLALTATGLLVYAQDEGAFGPPMFRDGGGVELDVGLLTRDTASCEDNEDGSDAAQKDFLPDVLVSAPGHVSKHVAPGFEEVRLSFAVVKCSVLVDHDGDGHLDLTSCRGTSLVTVRGPRIECKDRFQSLASAGGRGEDLATGDFNLDGRPDIVVAHDEGTVAILLGEGQIGGGGSSEQPGSQVGLILLGEPRIIQVGEGPGRVVVADWNADGLPDIAVASEASRTVTILLGNGDGTFRIGSTIGIPGSLPKALATGDLNNDGIADLVLAEVPAPVAVAASGEGSVRVLLGTGTTRRWTGDFEHFVQLRPTFTAHQAGDFDGDGIVDLVGQDSTMVVLKGTGTRGQGDGAFTADRANFWHFAPVRRIVAADFSGDRIADFAGVHLSALEMQRSRRLPDGGVGSGFVRSFANLPGGTAALPPPVAAHLDGDSVLDLVVVRNGIASIFFGSGLRIEQEAGLTAGTTFQLASLPGPAVIPILNAQPVLSPSISDVFGDPSHTSHAIVAADVDVDGDTDLISVDLVANRVHAALRGGGTDDDFILLRETGLTAFEENDAVATRDVFFGTAVPLEFEVEVTLEDAADGDGRIAVFVDAPRDGTGLREFIDKGQVPGLGLGTPLATAGPSTGTARTVMLSFTLDPQSSPKIPPGFFRIVVQNRFGCTTQETETTTEDDDPPPPPPCLSTISSVLIKVRVPFPQTVVTTNVFQSPPATASALPLEEIVLSEDIDRDGAPDLVALNSSGSEIAVLFGEVEEVELGGSRPIGSFARGQSGDLSALGGRPVVVQSADLNRDGQPDLLVLVDRPAVGVAVFLGRPGESRDGIFDFANPDATFEFTGFTAAAQTLRVVDANSDGVLDLVVSSGGTHLVLGQGVLTAQTEAPVVDIRVAEDTPVGFVDPPAQTNAAIPFAFLRNKPSLDLDVLVVGPLPADPDETTAQALVDLQDLFEAGDDEAAQTALDAILAQLCPAGTEVSSCGGIQSVQAHAAANPDLQALLDGLPPGRFQLTLRGRDADGAIVTEAHTWTLVPVPGN